MSEPIAPRAQDDLGKASYTLFTGLEDLLGSLTRELYGTTVGLLDLDGQPPTVQRDYRLARIAAATIITERLALESFGDAYAAGRVEGAPATYTDLARAAGLTKEGARGRWPSAVPGAKPGRPRKQVTVRLEGGHPYWDGYADDYDRAAVMDAPLEDVGGLYMIPDGSFPDHLAAEGGAAVDWRAHYAPTSEDTRTVWVFREWVPS